MSERDANQHLVDTARMPRGVTLLADPTLENTQRMDVVDRRERATEAREQMLGAAVADDVHRHRERRKPSTVGERQPAPNTAGLDARQAVIDFLNQQQGDL